MPRSKLNDHAKALTGAKAKKRDPVMEAINGRIIVANIPSTDLQKALGKSESTIRNRMSQPGGEWKIKDIVCVCKAIGLDVHEVLQLVSDKYY